LRGGDVGIAPPSIRLIETINGSNIAAAVRMHNTDLRTNPMHINALLRQVLVAYACGASGTGD
jgi:hypothetical protein